MGWDVRGSQWLEDPPVECVTDGALDAIDARLRELLRVRAPLLGRQRGAEPAASAEMIDDGQMRFKLSFADITKLPTARLFKDATVTRSDGTEKGTKVVTAKVVHPKPFEIPEATAKQLGNEVKFVVTFPGEIVESNARTTEGKTATWVYGLSEFHEMAEVPLTATYREAPAAGEAKKPPAKGDS